MIASIAPEEVRHRFHHGDTGREKKIVAPASRRHLSLDNSFWVNTTFAGWKPALHFFYRRERGGSQEASSPVCGEIFLVAALLRRVHLWFHFVTVFALVNADVADLLGRELHAALVDVA